MEIKDAEICDNYRYKLWRIWDDKLHKAMCIGLNPSNANKDDDDPTIRILRSVLNQLGYGGFYMVNLFAVISSKPKILLTCNDPVGDNERKLKEVKALCHDVIVCWGGSEQAKEKGKKLLIDYPDAKCFGKNTDGSPIHPRRLIFNGTLNNPQLFPYN